MNAKRRSGFTLTELMIAVAILIVVILATSRIFGTASAVTGMGEATINVMQEAAAIEREIRKDFARLSEDGFLAVRCVAVRNDINGAVLLNPALPPDAVLRADQLVFFVNGLDSIQTFRLSAGSNHKGQGTASRVYYGHAYQLPSAKAFNTASGRAHDVTPAVDLFPWYSTAVDGPVDMVGTRFITGNGDASDNFTRTADGTLDATQPEARQWLLARHSVVLVDDDIAGPGTNSKTVFIGNNIAGRSIFIEDPVIGTNTPQPQVRDGRVDAAATQLNDIRYIVTRDVANDLPNDWIQEQNVVAGIMLYPRAERVAPSMHRVDTALANHVIGSACSSFRVEWTWEDGVGDATNTRGAFFPGVQITTGVEHPWFGLCDPGNAVYPYFADTDALNVLPSGGPWWFHEPSPLAQTIDPDTLEQITPGNLTDNCDPSEPLRTYLAVFSYNQTVPFDPVTGQPWDPGATGVAYTPIPSAIRITMTLHDPNTRLAQGREFQFVVDLPKRK